MRVPRVDPARGDSVRAVSATVCKSAAYSAAEQERERHLHRHLRRLELPIAHLPCNAAFDPRVVHRARTDPRGEDATVGADAPARFDAAAERRHALQLLLVADANGRLVASYDAQDQFRRIVRWPVDRRMT